jgi:hypothetical protein
LALSYDLGQCDCSVNFFKQVREWQFWGRARKIRTVAAVHTHDTGLDDQMRKETVTHTESARAIKKKKILVNFKPIKLASIVFEYSSKG